MTSVLKVRNVNQALTEGFWLLKTQNIGKQPEPSRNGPVWVADGPVITEYTHPTERVLFNPDRDANPVFHLMEAIWMLTGDSRSEWITQFNSRFYQYAEDDGVIHGAYGGRWRGGVCTGKDQVMEVINILKSNPESRQAVIQMWDATLDLGERKRDIPCNTHIYFDCRGGVLNMTVCCRSNDALWGAYGANAVHMSFLQELIAAGVGIRVGVYRQMSNNFHAYANNEQVKNFMAYPPAYDEFNYYTTESVHATPLIVPGENIEDFLDDCFAVLLGHPTVTEFITTVASPLRDIYLMRKEGKPYDHLTKSLDQSNDWVTATRQWIQRREG